VPGIGCGISNPAPRSWARQVGLRSRLALLFAAATAGLVVGSSRQVAMEGVNQVQTAFLVGGPTAVILTGLCAWLVAAGPSSGRTRLCAPSQPTT
jgi:hypothetical protein